MKATQTTGKNITEKRNFKESKRLFQAIELSSTEAFVLPLIA